ncbi:uncharacterized protein LOC130645997 [Hydractinia symbiolongicarpus]|uniref:uncharacterized protein LOC130645997 n=1 Tax=Hydractinia symbiolongicarpus TaxID=13093 RepID=UPI00254DC9F1|nr:uncharacterized protein LOC130645997 [Hydractinia symbiolongicarpus]
MPPTFEKIKEEILKKIESGDILLGSLVEPKKYKKAVIKNGVIFNEEFTVSGRCIPLSDIRRKIFEEHQSLGIMRNPKGALTRYFILWSDHASLLSAGHLLLTVKVVYDDKLFYTDEEMYAKTGICHDVQELVERPSVYIIGFAQDSIAEKVSYVETRLNDIRKLSDPLIVNDKKVVDVIRFFHGDHPEIQYESGNSHGENFPCLCGCKKSRFTDIAHVYSNKIVSLEQRRKKVISGPAGQQQKAVSPFQQLNVEKLGLEVNYRNLDRDLPVHQKLHKKDLEQLLKNHLTGIIRVPALCFGNEHSTMESLNLANYEVMPIEPLHDCKGHIKNLWDVLHEVLTPQENKIFQQSLDATYGSKDKVRGSDYRLSSIVVYQSMQSTCRKEIKELLYTLMELVRLSYLKSQKRSPRIILRLHNISFQHAMLCQDLFGHNLKSMSTQKLYGIYYHGLTTHLAEVSRIISPSSLHTENEEQLFSKINQISLRTSARSLESIRDNSIIRIQAEQKFIAKECSRKSTNTSKISKFSESVLDEKRSCFNINLPLRKYQAHLERIADFLLYGNGVWWHRENDIIIFHDGKEDDDFRVEGPLMTNFKQDNLQSVAKDVEACWKKCVDRGIELPITKINTFDENGDLIECKALEETGVTNPKANITSNIKLMADDDNAEYDNAYISHDNNEEIEMEIDITLEQQPSLLDLEVDQAVHFEKETSNTITLEQQPCIADSVTNPKKTAENSKLEKICRDRQTKADQNPILESGVCKNIMYVLGYSDKLKDFDRHHMSYKLTKSEHSRKKCRAFIIHFREKVMAVQHEAEKATKDWEKDFIAKNFKMPNTEELKSNKIYMEKYKLNYHAKKILEQWTNI